MFGFPFFTSLIVVLAGVVAVSLIVNKGLARQKSKSMPVESNSSVSSVNQ